MFILVAIRKHATGEIDSKNQALCWLRKQWKGKAGTSNSKQVQVRDFLYCVFSSATTVTQYQVKAVVGESRYQ